MTVSNPNVASDKEAGMPWLETDPMTERKRFILEAQAGLFSHA